MDWCWANAKKRLKEKTCWYAQVLRVESGSVSVKDYKSMWGSCSATGDVSHNWRIVVFPHRIIDYVVVHELCHLLEHNHSPACWHHVERVLPGCPRMQGMVKTKLGTAADMKGYG